MAKLELALLVGGESKQFLADLTSLVDRLEAVANGVSAKTKKPAPIEEEEEVKPIAARKGKAAKVQEEEFDLGAEAEEEESAEDEDPITIKDVIAACKANREVAVKVLKKMKVNSVHELKPAQYSKVLAEIGA